MPWNQTSPVDQNTQIIAHDLRARLSVTERCERYGVSRQTGYTWVDRSLTHGPQGLEEHSRRPCTAPRQTPDHVVAAILELARCRRILVLACYLAAKALEPSGILASPSLHWGANAVWSADCRGHVQTGDGRYGYPWPAPTATAPSCSGVKPSPLPACRTPNLSSRACAKNSAYRSASALTTACRSLPTPSLGCPSCPRGGCARASDPRASNPANRNRTAATNVCIAP